MDDWTSVWEDDVVDHAELAVVLARAFPRAGTRSVVSRVGRARGRSCGSSAGRTGGWSRTPPSCGGSCRSTGARSSSATSGWSRSTRRATAPASALRSWYAVREALCGLGMPFGFLTCGERVAGFYARGGWSRVPGPTRMIRADGRMQVYGGVSMVLALATPLDAWPSGRIDRNGWEV